MAFSSKGAVPNWSFKVFHGGLFAEMFLGPHDLKRMAAKNAAQEFKEMVTITKLYISAVTTKSCENLQ